MIVNDIHTGQVYNNATTTVTPQAQAFTWLLQDPHLELYSDQRLVVRFVLATLYFATGGSKWVQNTDWLSYEHHECNWYYWDFVEVNFNATQLGMPPNPAVPCHVDGNRTFNIDEDATFRNLWLPKNNLHGSLPLELYLLTNLQSIVLYANQLEGSLATEIGQLAELKVLALLHNVSIAVWSMSTPAHVQTCHCLTQLLLQSLSGTLATELGLLSNLKVIGTFYNGKLGGNIPSELGLLTNLEYFCAWQCDHTGSIPTELGMATNLVLMQLESNVGAILQFLHGLKCSDTIF
jgi:hypothetical protein